MREGVRGVLIAVVALFLLECSLRVVATFRDSAAPGDDLAVLGVEFSPELGWERKPGFEGTLPREPGRPVRRFDARGFQPEEDAPADAPVVATVGDSSTFGWGAPPEASYPRVLARLLPETRVVNLGVLGYTTFQGYEALEKYGATLHPRVVIVASNYNDRRYVVSADAADSVEKFQHDDQARRVAAITSRVYLYRAVSFVMRRAGLLERPGRVGAVDDIRELDVRVPPESYRENLLRFVEYGRRTGAHVIFMTMADNPAYTEYLRRGVALLEKGALEPATRELQIAVALQNPFSDVARKFLVEALEKQGAHAAAEEARRLDRLQHSAAGGTPLYLDEEYNAIMRRVAMEHGVTLVDVARGPGRDPASYVDYCHPNERGYKAIAHLLHRRIRPLLAADGPAGTARLDERRSRP